MKSQPVWKGSPLPTLNTSPFSWDATHMDFYRTGYFNSAVPSETTRQSSGFRKSSRTGTNLPQENYDITGQAAWRWGLQDRKGQYRPQRSQKCPATIHSPHLCLSSPHLYARIFHKLRCRCAATLLMSAWGCVATDWRCYREMKYKSSDFKSAKNNSSNSGI